MSEFVSVVILIMAIVAIFNSIRYRDQILIIIMRVVVAAAILVSLIFAPMLSVWVACGLLLILDMLPKGFAIQADSAIAVGLWNKAIQFQKSATLLQPSRLMRVRLKFFHLVNSYGVFDCVETSKIISSMRSSHERIGVQLLFAFERAEWDEVLYLSRRCRLGWRWSKTMELRALGELGKIQEFTEVYDVAKQWIPLKVRRGLAIQAAVYAGRVDEVDNLMNSLPLFHVVSRIYWKALSRFRANPQDETALFSLIALSKIAESEHIRNSAKFYLNKRLILLPKVDS